MATKAHVCRWQAFRTNLADESQEYADDVVLLSRSTSGLQLVLNSLIHFCLGLGLVISSTRSEAVVFNGPGTASTQQLGGQILLQSASVDLVLVFHESGSLSYALQPKWLWVLRPKTQRPPVN